MSHHKQSQSHEVVPEDSKHQPRGSDVESASIDQALHDGVESVIEELSDGKLSLETRLADAEHQVLLAQAELENFRQRMRRESDQQLKYANLPLVRDLLDVIDNLNRATQAAGQDAQSNAAGGQALLEGVQLVLRQFESVLAKYGCQPIRSLGRDFDPNYHEAISQMPSQEHASGVVAHEVAVGYILHDRVVRPSSVIVSTGPGPG
ncbi:MAG: nucleotide exchange factor GrpE [Pirellulaceae bacterium]|nr:nucleotide exchange factor GrpE [Pirellulaceae bacterium]